MTDRIKGFVVVLNKDYRDDDVESTLNAIRQIKGVIGVESVIANGIDDTIAEMRIRAEITNPIIDILCPKKR